MDVLTRERAKPALAFAGSYRLIDSPLSSMAGSGVSDVWVSVSYLASTLDPYIAQGRPSDLDRTRGGYRRVDRHGRGVEERARHNGVVDVGRDGRVIGFAYKPSSPTGTTVATEICPYHPDVLLDELRALRTALSHEEDDGSSGLGDFGEYLLPPLVARGETYATPIGGS